MASTVGSLDSLDLLDLLFDRQDGILRGVELGTSPGTWHEDGVSPRGELGQFVGSSYSLGRGFLRAPHSDGHPVVMGARIPAAHPGRRRLPQLHPGLWGLSVRLSQLVPSGQ